MDNPLNWRALANIHEEYAKVAWDAAEEKGPPQPAIDFLQSHQKVDPNSCVQVDLSWVKVDSCEDDPLRSKSKNGGTSTTGRVMDWFTQDFLGYGDHEK